VSAGLPVVVLGAGPAGLAAADAISAAGQPVLIIDENHAPGGQIWRGGPRTWSDTRAHRLWTALTSRPHVELLSGARLVAARGPDGLLVESDSGARVVRWERLVLCTGARELLLPFPGWTLPGVTGAGGLQALIKGGMPVAGKRVVVAGSGPLLLAVAATVKHHGGEVVAVAEQRTTRELLRFGVHLASSHRTKLWQASGLALGLRGVPYLRGAGIVEATGAKRLESLVLDHGGARRELACDFLAAGFGLVPALETAGLFGCETEGGRVKVDANQATSIAGVWAAGEVTGIGGVDESLAEGRIAGLCAAGLALSVSDLRARELALAFARSLREAFAPLPQLKAMCQESTIVCRCEDVRARDLVKFDDWRTAKLQTRVGMGPCQGRVCGAACEFLYGWEAPGLREPVYPVDAAVLALR